MGESLLAGLALEEMSTNLGVDSIHDRIADAYYGKLGAQFMRETQRRIHWICANVRGKRVLDIGCSQGIVPILLAREGKSAIGLDADPLAIAEAGRLLQAEPPHVQANATFLNTEFLSHDFGEQRFDTIVLAEVLEHLLQPELFVEAAARLLAAQGRIIVTVPFGINDFIDHKRTYYLLEPYQLLARHTDVAEIAVLGKWLGLVGTRSAASKAPPLLQAAVKKAIAEMEGAYFAIECGLRDEVGSIRLRLDEAQAKYRAANEQAAALKQQMAAEEQVRQAEKQTIAELRAQLNAVEHRFTQERLARQEEAGRLKQAEAQRQTAAAAEEKLNRLGADAEALRARLEEANSKYRSATEQLAALRQRLAEEEPARQAAERSVAQLKTQLATEGEGLRQRLEEANAKYRTATEQINGLKQRLADEETARKAAGQALAQLKTQMATDIEGLRTRLDEANAKYRTSTEQVAAPKQRLAEEEPARQAAERTLAHLKAQLADAERRIEQERLARQEEVGRLQQQGQAQREATFAAEQKLARLAAEAKELRAHADEASASHRAATEQAAALQRRLAEEEVARRAAERSIERLQAELADTQQRFEKERSVRQEELALLQQQAQTHRQAASAAEEKLSRLAAEAQALRAHLDEANAKYRASTEQTVSLKQRLAEEEQARQAAQQGLTQIQAQLAEAERGLVQERLARQEERAGLLEQVQTQRNATLSAEGQLIRLAADVDGLHARLDEASAALHASSERAASLERRLAEEEAARRAAAENIAELERQLATTGQDLEQERQARQEEAARLNDQILRSRDELSAANGTVAHLQAELVEEHRRTETARDAAARMEAEVATLKALRRDQDHSLEQLKLLALKNKQSLATAATQLETLRQEKLAAEHRVARTKASLSYQLGYQLIHGFKSFAAVKRLPGALWALAQEARRRRGQKANPPRPVQRIAAAAAEAIEPRRAQPTPIVGAPGEEPSAVPSALPKLKVACVMDDFTFSSYKNECNLLQLTPQYWERQLEQFVPELLFIESAWRGKDDLWGNKVGHTSRELVGIVEWCRKKRIPSVFWNKEDPIHFQTFLTTAGLFDYVFTTDIDCIHRYKRALGHERVYLLPFACQPELTNPIEKYERKDAFCFAGAYYVRYPERTRDLANLVATLSEFRPVEIYDRNYGKKDPNYQFPEEYRPFIVGNLPFEEIDKAYKGYNYAINLNSIKQSQSMFARRVFELLASNTITVSNFSRGLRLLFGDLVLATDNGAEIAGRLAALTADGTGLRKFRLAALRKVMREHTYRDRIAYVTAKVWGRPLAAPLPPVTMTAYTKNQEQFEAVLGSFKRQSYGNRALVVVVPSGFSPLNANHEGLSILVAEGLKEMGTAAVCGEGGYVAGVVPDDYYGPNYLLDLALATRYSRTPVIGKAAHYVWSANAGLSLAGDGNQYRLGSAIAARAAIVAAASVESIPLREWVASLYRRELAAEDALAVDEFNYCRNGAIPAFLREHACDVDDLGGLDTGIGIDELIARAEGIEPEVRTPDEAPVITGDRLSARFNPGSTSGISMSASGGSMLMESSLPDGKHEYIYANAEFTPAELGFGSRAAFFLDTTPGLNLQIALVFLDKDKNRLGHVVKAANRNQDADLPAGTAWVRLGLRVYASGSAAILGLVLGHRPLRLAQIVGRAEHLVLTNHYPSYEDLYRNGFVHRRVAAYRSRGIRAEVFRFRPGEPVSYHEFEGVDVITGEQEALHRLLAGGRYKSVLVHFLDEAMWEVLRKHIDHIEVLVWAHGAEIQSWYRRDFNHVTETERRAAQAAGERRAAFWRPLLRAPHSNLGFVFVSNYLAQDAMQDLGVNLPHDRYAVIHNLIDTDLFQYREKPAEQRKKVLSIRPYASRAYANDLAVKAILELSKQPYFRDFEFRLIGDGALFDETVEPLREFSNVYIERRFLTQAEIARLHRDYGVFLCPSRMDTQGVSRDEAMSSGLVPVTTRVAAIPEFVDDSCGLLAEPEDASGLAAALVHLYENPEEFLRLSANAARRVRGQSGPEHTVSREIALIQPVRPTAGSRATP